jgi:plastocyanin
MREATARQRSHMKRLIPLTTVCALALAGSAQAATPQKTTLVATVGPGFTISLKKGGARVSTLKPGVYVIRVTDNASVHNFHLRGPGVNKSSSVAFTGKRTFQVTLRKGTYRYQCDPHSGQMRGSFTVR